MPGIRDKHRKTFVGVFTGEEFRLRKIPPSEFLGLVGSLPVEQSDTLAHQLQGIGERVAEISKDEPGARQMLQFWLEHGVTSPKIFFGAYDECPENMVHVDDLSDDANGLMQAIAEFSFDFSGFKKKMGDLLQGEQPDASGHAGEEVREVANGSAPAGDGQ